jgi:hypothetical protein
MLKEHFRCVEPIIRFSMKFYNQELVPLRVPKASERLDPPLIDIFVEGGERRGKSKVNPREADVIVSEIETIVGDPEQAMIGGEARPRSIGVNGNKARRRGAGSAQLYGTSRYSSRRSRDERHG